MAKRWITSTQFGYLIDEYLKAKWPDKTLSWEIKMTSKNWIKPLNTFHGEHGYSLLVYDNTKKGFAKSEEVGADRMNSLMLKENAIMLATLKEIENE